MDKAQQMGASRPEQRSEGSPKRGGQTAALSGQQQGQQSGQQAVGASGSGQMQSTQFTDWASI